MTLVVAHRGASAAHPPGNTLPAFAAAVELGADVVELDVHLTDDGVSVVHHDPDLADGRVIGDLRRDELPDWVPTLAEAFAASGPLGVNVEIKPDGPARLRERLIAAVVEQITATGAPDHHLVTSFDHDIVDAVRTLAPEIPTGLLVVDHEIVDATVDRAARDGHGAVAPWWGFVDAGFVEDAHRRGIRVNVWTVDDPDVMTTLVRAGVDALITNVPDLGRAIVDLG